MTAHAQTHFSRRLPTETMLQPAVQLTAAMSRSLSRCTSTKAGSHGCKVTGKQAGSRHQDTGSSTTIASRPVAATAPKPSQKSSIRSRQKRSSSNKAKSTSKQDGRTAKQKHREQRVGHTKQASKQSSAKAKGVVCPTRWGSQARLSPLDVFFSAQARDVVLIDRCDAAARATCVVGVMGSALGRLDTCNTWREKRLAEACTRQVLTFSRLACRRVRRGAL